MTILPGDLALFLSPGQEDGKAPEPGPFSKETVEELERYQAVFESSIGPITVALLPTNGEQTMTRITLTRVRVERIPD
jgi:hypothetical protein